MRRPTVLLVASALAVTILLPTSAPAAQRDVADPDGGPETRARHYLSENRWSTRRDDSVYAVAARHDLVAVAGLSIGASSVVGFVRALRPDLTPLWDVPLSGNLTTAEAVGTDGQIVAAGGSTYSDLDPDDAVGHAWLQVYDENGTPLWTRQTGDLDGDKICAIEVTDDAIFAAGRIAGIATVWKYDRAGDLLWDTELVHVTGNSATDLALMGDRVIVAEERLWDDASRIVALDAETGAIDWSTPPVGRTAPVLATDGTSVFAAGQSYEDGFAEIESYDSEGAPRWSRDIYVADDLPGPDTWTEANALVWDGNSLIVSARIALEAELIAFDADGHRGWRVLPPGYYDTRAAVFGPGGLYVGGNAQHPNRPTDWEGIVSRYVVLQPDARARFLHSDELIGDDVYAGRQRLPFTVEGVKPRSAVLSAQNDGEIGQRLRVTGCASHSGYAVRYLDPNGRNVTDSVTGSGWRTRALAPAGQQSLTVVITPRRRTTGATTCAVTVTSPSADERDRFVLAITRP
ncbi:hypothetical protein F0U44_21335 [Nocardioides humilatus]|uniref:Pyrrolo-quinoline quinone repeat domain-containing protein n=1 Tax=Nocardioides humilatus TaxID=2607660 RepID=A0A5B1L4E1_9ACTN|nr:PQQ-binding-like beta-propeller repeat protein [Nocardioides humilatus]KAA1415523.1 hypothetical protein F0U44_21335 [Nocardioides humilatus]